MQLDEKRIWQTLDGLTKPPRSLGRLEELAARLCLVQGALSPQTSRRLVLFAADHGVVASGVSVWPSDVTRLIMETIRAGKAASNALARAAKTEITLVDVGSFGASDELQGKSSPDAAVEFVDARVRAGARNLAVEPAMTADEFARALAIGRRFAVQSAERGARIVAAGELGIGNTTSAACLTMLLTDAPSSQAVGRGAGADDATLARKLAIVENAATSARREFARDSVAAMASVAGLEIAAMAGFYLQAKALGLTIILDGYVTAAAALIADFLEPGVSESMIASHLSAEPGHAAALKRLRLEPFLEWNLRLGEGTGALLLMPLIDAAAAITSQMATFAELGIQPVGGAA